MAKEVPGRQNQLRQLIAQQAARMIAEDGIADFAYAKRKAGRQLGVVDANCLPSNAEVEEEIRLHHEIYHSEDQPKLLHQLRTDALTVMQLLERFNPHLTGSVLDGTAGKHAETHIHLFADSAKEVEIFLLNQQIPYQTNEKSYRVGEKRSNERMRVPVLTLEGPNGLIKLSIFEYDDMRFATKNPANGSNVERADISDLQALLNA